MEQIIIRPIEAKEAELCQKIFNEPSIVGLLGGMTHLDTIKGKIRGSGVTLWGAFEEGKIVGSVMIAGRNQCHYAKFGEVGVLPEYRRKRIATALYSTILCQGVLEGRRLWEDTIVGDNPYQFAVLPTIGLEHWAVLKAKTASFKDIHLFGYNLSLEKLIKSLGRVPDDIIMTIREDYYTHDLWSKNMEVYVKKNRDFVDVINSCREYLDSHKQIIIAKGDMIFPHNKNKQQKSILDF